MKNSINYFIYTATLFFVIFTLFSAILYLNIRNDVIKDEFIKNDILLGNIEKFIKDDIKDFRNSLTPNSPFVNNVFLIDSFQYIPHNEVLDSFINNDFLLMHSNNQIYIKCKDYIYMIDNSLFLEKILSFNNKSLSLNIIGYNYHSYIEDEIDKQFSYYTKNPVNYGFFQTKDDIVNFKKLMIDNNIIYVFLIKSKSVIFKQLNNFALLFTLVIFIMIILMLIFIIFYIDAYTSLIKREEKTKQELELLKMNKLLGIEKMSSALVHDINNPLTSAIGFLEILNTKNKDLSEKYHIPIILKNLYLIGNRIKDTLSRTKKEISGEKEYFNLNKLLKEKIEFYYNIFTQKRINVIFDPKENLPNVFAFYGDFSMIFNNLFDNAIDAMYESKEKNLIIKTDFDNKFIYIKIEDSGTGIPEEIMNKIFDIYFTTKPRENSESNAPTGTGIGLFSVKKAINRNNAKIHIDSYLGKGTIFTITIPY